MNGIKIIITKKLSTKEENWQTNEWEKADKEFFGPDYKKYDWGRYRDYIKAYNSEGYMVGLIEIDREGGVAFVEELIVDENYRRLGIGTYLMQHAEEFARQHNCHKLTLETHEDLVAVKLYEKLGYKVETKLTNHYGKKTWLVMSKNL